MTGQSSHPTCTDCIKSVVLMLKRVVLGPFYIIAKLFNLIIDFPHTDSIFKLPHSFCGLRPGPFKTCLKAPPAT